MAQKNSFTKEEREAYRDKKQAQVKEYFRMIEEGVKNVFTSQKYKEYLDTVSKFRQYSPNNTMLIMLQKPSASLVAGFNKWKEFGRNVKKGEKAIQIIAPYKKKIEKKIDENERDEFGNIVYNEDGTEKKKIVVKSSDAQYMTYFKIVPVFDISQTEGKPLPEIVHELPKTVTLEYASAISSALDDLVKVKHETEKLKPGLNGYCDYKNNRIVLNEDLNPDMQIRTHIHEVTHYLLHGEDGMQKERSKEQREMQAESVAYVISKRLGIDTSDYSFGYVAGWSGKDIKELKLILSDTIKTVEVIYNHVDSALKELNARKCENIQEAAAAVETEIKENSETKQEVISKEVIDLVNDEFVWVYYNPDGDDGSGQFLEMHINEHDIKEAFKDRMITERAYGYDKGLEVFFNLIEQNAYTVIIDNDGSKQYEEYKNSILYGKHDLIFKNALDSVSRNNAIREFMLQNSEYFQHLEKNAAKQGCKPVTTFMASTMWENGFTLLDSNYNSITPFNYEDHSSNDYSVFNNAKDFTFYVSHNDHAKQQLFDEISENIESIADLEEYALYNCYDDYEWDSYDDSLSITENVQDALRRNDIIPLQKYLFEVHRECYGSKDMQEIFNCASQAARAVAEYKTDLKRDKEIVEQTAKKADEILDLVSKKETRNH